MNTFDSADPYSHGLSEKLLGQAVAGRREKVLLATKGSFRMGDDPNDALSPVEETLSALDQLVRSGKVRYIGCSNFSGWHVMKSLGVSDGTAVSAFF